MRQHGNTSFNDTTIAYIHGRIEREIESICIATGVPFGFVAARIAELLHPMGSQRTEGQMPLLRSIATNGSATVATLEVVEHSHHHEAPSASTSEIPDHRSKAVSRNVFGKPMKSKTQESAQRRWSNMSKTQKDKMLDKMYKARYGKNRPKKNGYKKSATTKAKQKMYQARHEAKKKGLPLPPLPKEGANSQP